MCCFSGKVSEVSGTQIFARLADGREQILVYSMNVAAPEDVAMILPLPVPPASPERAVTWIDLSDYPDLFVDLNQLFPEIIFGPGLSAHAGEVPPLEVFAVGSFEASFVPSPADFARLDPRFRLPDTALAALPQYADWGFAVFKLAPGAPGAPRTIHPMAFRFPLRDPTALFYPMVHVHDGQFHPRARYDHTLYCQVRNGDNSDAIDGWDAPYGHIAVEIDVDRTRGVIDPELEVNRIKYQFEWANEDKFVPLHESEWR